MSNDDSTVKPRVSLMTRLRLLAALTVWAYIGAALAICGAMWVGGDRWWLPTVVLFGPRELFVWPLAVLLPLVLVLRWRLVLPLALTGVVLLFGLLGFRLPWGKLRSSGPPELRVLSLNVHGSAVNRAALMQLVSTTHPDVVLLQECSPEITEGWPPGWSTLKHGQLVLASWHPMTDCQTARRSIPPSRWPPINALYASVQLAERSIGVCNVHLRTPGQGLSEVLDSHIALNPRRSGALRAEISVRVTESQRLISWIDTLPAVDVVGGDFNMPVESAIYRRWWSRFANAFSTVGFGLGYTKWTLVPQIRYGYGARIDHVLSGDGWRPSNCFVGPDVGSDHRPLIADLTPSKDR